MGAIERREAKADLSMNLALTRGREMVTDYSVAYLGLASQSSQGPPQYSQAPHQYSQAPPQYLASSR